MPLTLPPDRNLNDIHNLDLINGSTPPNRKIYKVSPAEQ